MQGVSPFTRRFIALGVLLVLVISALNLVVLPTWLQLRQSLSQLGDGRFQRAQDEAVVARRRPDSGPPISSATYIAASTGPAAASQLEAHLRADAAATNVHLLAVGRQADPLVNAARLSATVSVEGEEVALVGFINRVEQNPPLVRFRRWHIAQGTREGLLRFDGEIEAAWGHP